VAEWFGIPATGKRIVTQGVDIFLLRDGRLAEHWDVVDVNDFLVKTGALTAPSAAQGAGR
jgi:predicted SnoaL-like aldol condensation-catalyzing enzyme